MQRKIKLLIYGCEIVQKKTTNIFQQFNLKNRSKISVEKKGKKSQKRTTMINTVLGRSERAINILLFNQHTKSNCL